MLFLAWSCVWWFFMLFCFFITRGKFSIGGDRQFNLIGAAFWAFVFGGATTIIHIGLLGG